MFFSLSEGLKCRLNNFAIFFETHGEGKGSSKL